IAKKLGVSKYVVHRVLKAYKESDSYKAGVRSGRPKKLNERDKREILHEIRRDATTPLTTICKTLSTPVSVKTLRTYLRSAGIRSRKTIE
ncbi:Homeodomain-like DNA binding domain-containing transcription factor, partial [Phycomyces blakesleeanus NRRL 1555(-)]